MNQPKEKPWSEIFAYDLPARVVSYVNRECCDACLEAREIKCVCACGGKNHGAALKKDVKRLDNLLELDGLDIFPVEPPTPEELSIW